MAPSEERFLLHAIELAKQARSQGEDPFGAVLVHDGVIVYQAHDGTIGLSDPTAHAEMRVIRECCQAEGRLSLEGYALYCSAEPCMMCAGAIHWAGISRVVFSVTQDVLQRLSGGRPKPSCASILKTGGGNVEVIGPLLTEEGLAVFEGFVFVPKEWRGRPK